MILVTGCARSGTMYMSKVLKAFGKDIPHERIGKDGSVGWHLGALTGGPSPPNLDGDYGPDIPYFDEIWHQVRHPIDVIGSWLTVQPNAMQFAGRFIGRLPEDPIIGSMVYWLKWNELIEQRANWRYRLEDVDLQFICEKARGQWQPEALKITKNTNTRANHYRRLTWQELEYLDKSLSYLVRSKAEEYGYSV